MDLEILMGGRKGDEYFVLQPELTCHVVLCLTFGDAHKVTSILRIS